ncbi:hypothetical protein DID75_04590 [Candidatus Marinamargulisbacteria bacterium SCGC AG-410-N11]|nr:hypothetical protein DID75_04590 [Candidatus Marinamargulisbacteria bacterium SCGC AG-410-N11]
MAVLIFLQKGGWLMAPILLTMLVGFYFAVNRYLYLHQNRVESKELQRSVITYLDQQNFDEALQLLDQKSGCVANMFKVGISNWFEGQERLESRLKQVFYEEYEGIHRHLSTIQIIAAILPMLGLLGTVTGMITVFKAIASVGVGDPQAMAGGISQALITTQTGLAAAIPILFCHSVLSDKAEGLDIELKKTGTIIQNMVKRQQKQAE